MKEYQFPLNSFSKGLRPEITTARTSDFLVESLNAAPGKGGLRRQVPINSAFPSISIDFPFPQLFFFKEFTLIGTRAGVYELQDDGTWLQVITKDVSEAWEMLDFGSYILIVNIGVVWGRNIDTGEYEVDPAFPFCTSIENFNGQLITIGNIEDFSLKPSRVTWSKIGSKDFTVDRSNIAGWAEIEGSGLVRNVLSLDGGFVVYSENAVTWFMAVNAPTPTFGKRRLLNFGIPSKGAVCKGDGKHLALMTNGDLYEITSEGKKYIGFGEFFDSFEEVRITYNPIDDEFYISNGLRTYIYSSNGLGQVSSIITSGGIFEGDFYAMARSAGSEAFLVTTDTFDLGTRGQKTIYAIELQADAEAPIEVAVYWRSNVNEGFRLSKWTRCGPSGIATLIVAGIEFRLAVRVEGPGEVNISSANIRWKLTDKRSIRGQYGATK